MKKVLIIGGSGFIGRSLTEVLSATHPHLEVHASFLTVQPIIAKSVTWHQLDLFDKNAVEGIFRSIQPEYLVNLAWCSEHGKYWNDPMNLEWVNATLHAAKCFTEKGGKRCLVAGTSAEYDWTGNLPLNEASIVQPSSVYGASKRGVYIILSKFFLQQGVSFIWPRLFNPFGPFENKKRLIPRTCLALLNNIPMTLDHGMTYRDFLHVEDVSYAICQVLFSEQEGPINIASGTPISIRQVVTEIAQYYNKDSLVHFHEAPDGVYAQDFVVADNDLLGRQLGWKPKANFQERLFDVCDWWSASDLINKK